MKAFKTESKKLLDMMINSIYTNHEVFLRELISNASDALDKARLALDGDAAQDCEFAIHVAFDREARTLTVSDTGIGMSAASLEECLGTIAHSGSGELASELARTDASADVDLIGRFGVGFYSSFMVADEVTVVSRALGSDETHQWKSNGVDGYSISPAKRAGHGTDVILHVRESSIDENLERYLDQESLVQLIRKYSNYIRYPITMDLAQESFEPNTGALIRDESSVTATVVNSMTPLWARAEEDVTPEETNEFYRREFHDGIDPARTISLKVRGAIEYDALLFVPQEAPAELYTKDYAYGLKLYSSGVLIDDNFADLLPSHFRFVRGIVDTSSIDLNVSREMIQEDGRIAIISRQIERSIIDNLKAMIADDREGYERFFEEFGTGLKFAICSSRGTLTEVVNSLLLYYSAQNRRLVTLQEYLEATDQSKHTEIYFAAGTDIERLTKAPSVQAMLDRGRDVLLCPHGAQDELCFMLMGTYKGARFRSVTSADLDIDGEGDEDEAAQSGDAAERDRVLEVLYEYAARPLARVVASKHLARPDEAASRVVTEEPLTLSMAKYLAAKEREHGQGPTPLFVLEVNVHHRMFALAKAAVARRDIEVLRHCSRVLLGQALLVEDIPLADPTAFNEATNALILRVGADA